MRVAVRILGALTAGYGLFELTRPATIARQAGLDASAPALRILTGTLGVRDIVSGSAMFAARTPRGRSAAVTARVLFDLGDAVLFAALLPDGARKAKVAAVAGGWGGLCGLAHLAARERPSSATVRPKKLYFRRKRASDGPRGTGLQGAAASLPRREPAQRRRRATTRRQVASRGPCRDRASQG